MHSMITFDVGVPNMLSWGNFRKIARLIHFGAHFHIFLRKSMENKRCSSLHFNAFCSISQKLVIHQFLKMIIFRRELMKFNFYVDNVPYI